MNAKKKKNDVSLSLSLMPYTCFIIVIFYALSQIASSSWIKYV